MSDETKYDEEYLANYPLDGLDIDESYAPDIRPWGMDLNQYCMFMHLSQYAGIIVPYGGLVLPIVMWSMNKDKHPLIDQNGKNILNWIISSTIYAFISVILMFFIIGFFTIFALLICFLIFTIIGAVKANEGKVYKYPLTIQFVK